MEHTAKKQNGKGWLLPIILLVIGFICASWLSLQPTQEINKITLNDEQVPADTIVKPKVVVPVTVVPKPIDVEPVTIELEEPIALDLTLEPLRIMLDNPIDLDIMDMDMDMDINMDFDFDPIEIRIDTIPAFMYKFDKTFDESFKMNFQENMNAMRESMREMEEVMARIKKEEIISKEVQDKLQRVEQMQLEKMQKMQELYQDEMMKVQEEKLREVTEKMQAVEKVQKEKLVAIEQKMKAFEKVMREYQKELKEELIKDGYVKKGEEIEIRWRDEKLEINNKKIKDKDQAKYKAIQEKYFKGGDIHINWE